MEKLKKLQDWRALAPQMVDTKALRTNPALQPRDVSLEQHKDKPRIERESAAHVARLCAVLDGGRTAQLDPLLVAEVDGVLLLVDGHHRLQAYRRAKRTEVPAQVLRMTLKDAALLSKLVNAEAVKLPLTKRQAAEACWQVLAELTHHGRTEPGMSLREIAGMVGGAVSKDTVRTMLRNLQTIKLEEFAPAARDPATGWPRWKYVRQAKWSPQVELRDPAAFHAWQAGKDAAKLAALRDTLGAERFNAAARLLLDEAKGEASEPGLASLREWSSLLEVEPAEF